MANQAQAIPRTRRGELMKESAKTELRPGIGLCDQCMEPRWPQKYVGYGIMLCEDCQTSKPKETPMTQGHWTDAAFWGVGKLMVLKQEAIALQGVVAHKERQLEGPDHGH